jgi:hypothetical protein
MRPRATWILALAAGLAAPGAARPAAAERPTPVDIAACRDFARAQPTIPTYTETVPANPFPTRLSHVGPWTGPVTAAPAPLPSPPAPRPAELPEASGGVEASGPAREAASEPSPVDPPFQDAFDACMRARGF